MNQLKERENLFQALADDWGNVRGVGLALPGQLAQAPLPTSFTDGNRIHLATLNEGSPTGREGCQPPTSSFPGDVCLFSFIVNFSCLVDLDVE